MKMIKRFIGASMLGLAFMIPLVWYGLKVSFAPLVVGIPFIMSFVLMTMVAIHKDI